MSTRTIYLLLLAAALAVAGYASYTYIEPATPDDTAEIKIAELEAGLNTIRRLKDTDFDTAVLQDPLFRALRPSAATSGPAVNPGRPNPFLPF